MIRLFLQIFRKHLAAAMNDYRQERRLARMLSVNPLGHRTLMQNRSINKADALLAEHRIRRDAVKRILNAYGSGFLGSNKPAGLNTDESIAHSFGRKAREANDQDVGTFGKLGPQSFMYGNHPEI